jgi:hypothetical protein
LARCLRQTRAYSTGIGWSTGLAMAPEVLSGMQLMND